MDVFHRTEAIRFNEEQVFESSCWQSYITQRHGTKNLSFYLGESRQSPTFINHYRERKQLLQQMFDVEDDAEVIDYIKMTKQHKKGCDTISDNNTKLEKKLSST